jgi:hypothetical protein
MIPFIPLTFPALINHDGGSTQNPRVVGNGRPMKKKKSLRKREVKK